MRELKSDELRRRCDPEAFDFRTTAELEPYVGLIGQDRAVEAISLGLSIDSAGFNICVTGEPGTGRTTAVHEYLEQHARTKAVPSDWCYIHNFRDPYMPRAISLSPGKGRELQTGMAAMLAHARERIPQTFESDEIVKRRDEIIRVAQRHHEDEFSGLAVRARQAGFLLQGSPAGFFLVPMVGDQPIDDRAFAALPADQREALMHTRDELMEDLRRVTKEENDQDALANQQLANLEQTVATTLADSLLHQLFEQFKESSAVVDYLSEVRQNLIENVREFQPQPPQTQLSFMPTPMRDPSAVLRKYEVNLLTDSTEKDHAPVIFETNPTPQHLFGRIEKEAFFGTVTTDFTMIRPGSLHRANGGFLVLDFDDILAFPFSWNELKRTLRTGELTIEEMGDRLGYLETKTLRPQAIPWEGKVILLARESVYRLLYALDPDFRDLFKVKADFDLHIERSAEHELSIAQLVAGVLRRESLLPFDRTAIARVIEEAARLADDQNKLSIRFGELTDIVRESVYWARKEGADVATGQHVRRALTSRLHRVNLVEEHVRDTVAEGLMVFELSGEAIGQVNGLSVLDIGDTSFGQPARITANIGVGREGIVDLQRASELAGPIHSKAVLTLRGFLLDRYAGKQPLSLSASIAFEQNYGIVEGDSATCAEVCALLSVLSDLPLRQSLAITGSMDQRGQVQAVGGVNQKIEGFFDVCSLQGLTGEQGVIMPAANVQHLMLRDDILDAVTEGRFHIFAVSTIDEALELLTGANVGQRNDLGVFPIDSLNGRVQARLAGLVERLRLLGQDVLRRDEAEYPEQHSLERV